MIYDSGAAGSKNGVRAPLARLLAGRNVDTDVIIDDKQAPGFPQDRRGQVDRHVASARFALAFLTALYVAVLHIDSPSGDYSFAFSLPLFGAYALVAFVRWLYFRDTDNRLGHQLWRERLEGVADTTLITTAIAIGGTSVIGLYTAYLWTIFGSGFFYGISAMWWTAGSATVGFSLVSYFSPAWDISVTATAGLMAGLPISLALCRHILLAQRTHELVLIEYASAWERLAAHDPLSGLPNRRSFSEALRSMILRKHPFVLLLFDLDNFKIVNDTYGHTAGDAVIQIVARRALNQVCEASHTVARLGGDEFAVMIEGAAAATGHQFMDRLRSAIQEPLQISKDITVTIDASMGMACFPHDGQMMTELIATADRAMYQDKLQEKSPDLSDFFGTAI
jgi:diguanylate cyclase (GGDEF)-like protein